MSATKLTPDVTLRYESREMSQRTYSVIQGTRQQGVGYTAQVVFSHGLNHHGPKYAPITVDGLQKADIQALHDLLALMLEDWQTC